MTDYLVEKGYNVNSVIDILGTALAEDYKKTFDKLKNSETDSIVAILTPQAMSQPEETAQEIINLSKFKSVIAVFLGRGSIQKAEEILKKNKISCITDI